MQFVMMTQCYCLDSVLFAAAGEGLPGKSLLVCRWPHAMAA